VRSCCSAPPAGLFAAIAATPFLWLKTAVSLAIIAGLASVILVMLMMFGLGWENWLRLFVF
jgi:hypothetical protein